MNKVSSAGKTYPIQYALMVYGVDHLSNQEIRKLLKIEKGYKGLKRINLSNLAITFNSKMDL